MFRRVLAAIAIVGALIAILLAQRPAPEPLISGRNNTVLFLTDSHPGQSNGHVAAVSQLIESHPLLEIHYASFPSLANRLERIKAKHSKAKIHWYELDAASLVPQVSALMGGDSQFRAPPGLPGLQKYVDIVTFVLAAWPKEDHLKIYRRIAEIIEEVDPAIIILDQAFRPGVDAARNLNRKRAYISPNAILDNVSVMQPRGGHFWKYPG